MPEEPQPVTQKEQSFEGIVHAKSPVFRIIASNKKNVVLFAYLLNLGLASLWNVNMSSVWFGLIRDALCMCRLECFLKGEEGLGFA